MNNAELCIVLEYMSRGNLYNLIHVEKYRLADKEKRRISFQVVEGVKFLHHEQASGMPAVHRDLKSMNVVLDQGFNAKLCDFGLTQSMEKTHLTRKDQEGGKSMHLTRKDQEGGKSMENTFLTSTQLQRRLPLQSSKVI